MRCLYCGKQLALLRRLTGSGEFCSDAHKQSYHEEYNRLALTRLIAAQSKPDEPRGSGSSLNPLTMPLGLANSKKMRATGDLAPASASPSARWNEVREAAPSRMIPAVPVEAPPPPAAPFILGTTKPASATPAEPVQLVKSIPFKAELSLPVWDPRVERLELKPQDPPLAAALPLFAAPIAPAPPTPFEAAAPPASAPFNTIPVANPMLAHRAPAGFKLKPPVPLEATAFLPGYEQKARIARAFEAIRLATMIFGAPELHAIAPHDTHKEPPRSPEPAPERAPELTPEPQAPPTPLPYTSDLSSLEALRVAASPEPPPVKIPEPEDRLPQRMTLAERLTANNERPRPQLPTLSPVRKAETPLVEPSPAPDAGSHQEGRSLWETLRKYIKG